jgi:tetratricopeptide (TPR) repeat protein
MPGKLTRSQVPGNYQLSICQAATKICDRELGKNRNHAFCLYLRGILMSRDVGHRDAVNASLLKAVWLEPTNVEYAVALGDALRRSGRLTDALSAFLCAFTHAPRDASLCARLGDTLRRLRLLREAYALYEEAAHIAPICADIHRALGDIQCLRNRLTEGIQHYEAAVKLDAREAKLYCRLGLAQLRQGDSASAFASFERGLRLSPEDADLYAGLGQAFLKTGEMERAIDSFRETLVRNPFHVMASRQLARVEGLRGRTGEAAHAWLHLGDVLQAEVRYEEAAAAYQQAVAHDPHLLPAMAGLAHMHLACGRPSESLPWARQAVSRTPHDGKAHMDLATSYHLMGETEDGWDEFAHHYDPYECRRRGYDVPLWDGGVLNGRTILLWPDMGHGDTIQFLRYIPVVSNYGGRVLVACHHPRLMPIIERIPGVSGVFLPGVPLPHYDVHAPLNLFPSLFRKHRTPVLNDVPYVFIAPELIASWRSKLGRFAGRTVGLSWGGNAETRSATGRFTSLATFAPLGDVRGVRFISLQHGPQAAELLVPPGELSISRILDDSSSIADVAAVITCVDLVITVDTMVAHLTGALAKPVWTVLRYATNWRWQIAGGETPWYPTMRLFRQSRPGDWAAAVARVREALDAWATDSFESAPDSHEHLSSCRRPGACTR